LLRERQLSADGLTAVTTHLLDALSGCMAQIGEGVHQSLSISELGLDGAEVRHRGQIRAVDEAGWEEWALQRSVQPGGC
jgi:hypothetical protein